MGRAKRTMSTQLVSVSESCFKWLLFCGCGSHPPAQEHEEEEEEDAAPPEPAPLAKLVEDQSGCKKEFDDWIEEHMGGLIKRYDLDGNHSLDASEQKQLTMNSFFALTKHLDQHPQYRLATTVKDVEALETGSDGMTGDEYIAWFTANINFIERSAKKKKFISRKKKSARAEMERRNVNIWDGIEIDNLGAMAAEVWGRYDENMDGELTEDEMAPLAMDMLKAHPELIRLFNEYISMDKLAEDMEKHSRMFAKEIFNYADVNGDKSITRIEFANFFQK